MNRPAWLAMLRRHEGRSLKAYRCSRGVWSIGYGHTGPEVHEGMEITEEEAERLLSADAAVALADARSFPWFCILSENRQQAIASMLFNLGIGRFRGFKRLIAALEVGEFSAAADEMLASHWRDQVGDRALELAALMRMG